MGVYLTGEGSNVAGSFLYILTLSHLVHLAGGLIALFVAAINIKTKKYNSKSFLGLEITAIYWHFLSVLWIYLFFFLKYL
jgi:cytochrome c oxidase subunit 3